MAVTFEQVGGRTCLDFVNTGSQRREGPFKEGLNSYGDLVDWSVQTGELGAEEAGKLRELAERDEAGAEAVLERAHALREAIYRVFTARAAGETLPEEDLGRISQENARAAAYRVLTPSGVGKCSFEWRDTYELDRPLWPVAISAVNLAASDAAERVKECATDNCNWLFLDASKNRSRKWCEMSECGNRAKARRHYHRTKQ